MRDDETIEDVRKRALRGSAFDQNELGAFLATGNNDICDQDEVQARHWYLQAVKQGYLESKWNLGTMLLNHEGGLKDVEKGMFLIEQAAAEGHSTACSFLGHIYESGEYGKVPDMRLASIGSAKSNGSGRWTSGRTTVSARRRPISNCQPNRTARQPAAATSVAELARFRFDIHPPPFAIPAIRSSAPCSI